MNKKRALIICHDKEWSENNLREKFGNGNIRANSTYFKISYHANSRNEYEIFLFTCAETAEQSQIENIKQKIKDIINGLNEENYEVFVLLHKNPWEKEQKTEILNYIQQKGISGDAKLFSLGYTQEVDAYNGQKQYGIIVALLGRKASLRPNHLDAFWEKYFKKKHEYIYYLFLPHLALQAFWGISVKRITNNTMEFIKYGKREINFGDEELKGKFEKQRNPIEDADVSGIDEDLLRLFPNADVFKLPEEAEFDYFAPLFDIFFGGNKREKKEKKFNCEEEEKMYEERINLEEIVGDKENFQYKIKYGDKEENVNFEHFKKCLKELCAMLANAEMCKKDNREYGYKGNSTAEIQNELKNLNEKLRMELFTEKHCKVENCEGHSYENLKKQIIEWGIENAMVVIGGIEVLVTNGS